MIAVTDQVLLLDCLTPILKQHDIELVAKAQTGNEIIALAKQHQPDLLLCSVSLHGLSGVLLCEQFKAQFPDIKIILLAKSDELAQMVQAVSIGVHAIVTLDSDLTQLTNAFNKVLRGSVFIPDHISPLLVQTLTDSSFAKDLIKLDLLNMKQKLILQLTAQGCTAKQIADKLFLSRKTVEFHRSSITKKLAFANHADWVRFAIRNALIDA